jgi:hypothetical protein
MNRTVTTESIQPEHRLAGSWFQRKISPYLDRATILGIVLLVVLVTLPRLRSLAIHENEIDALRTLGVLGGEVFASESAPPDRLGQLFTPDSGLERRLADTRVLEDGRLLLRYGYLFELVGGQGGRGVRAWPVEHGRTGHGAFWLDAERGLHGSSNREARWSGVERPPAPSEAREWNTLELPGSRSEGV